MFFKTGNLTKVLITGLALFLAEQAPAVSSAEVLRLYASPELIDKLFPIPPDGQTDVDDHFSDRVIRGKAYTSVSSHLELLDCEDCIKLKMSLDLTTSTRVTTATHPREDIFVNVLTTALTQTRASKVVIGRPDKMEALPLESSSATALTLHGVNARAKGPFSGEKRKQAEQIGRSAFFEARARKEEEVSQRLDDQIREMIEGEKAKRAFESFNRNYYKIFYEPFFVDGDAGRSLHFSSTSNLVSVSVDSVVKEPPTPAPAFDGGNALGLRIHESLLTSQLSAELGAKHFNEEDLEEYLIMHGIAAGLGHYHPEDAQMLFDFCEDKPFSAAFRALQIHFELCTNQIELRGVKSPSLRIAFNYTSRIAVDGGLELWRLEEPELIGKSAFTPKDSKEVVARLVRLFPEQLLIPKIRLPGKAGSEAELAVHRADLGEGWLVTELWFDPSKKAK